MLILPSKQDTPEYRARILNEISVRMVRQHENPIVIHAVRKEYAEMLKLCAKEPEGGIRATITDEIHSWD